MRPLEEGAIQHRLEHRGIAHLLRVQVILRTGPQNDGSDSRSGRDIMRLPQSLRILPRLIDFLLGQLESAFLKLDNQNLTDSVDFIFNVKRGRRIDSDGAVRKCHEIRAAATHLGISAA